MIVKNSHLVTERKTISKFRPCLYCGNRTRVNHFARCPMSDILILSCDLRLTDSDLGFHHLRVRTKDNIIIQMTFENRFGTRRDGRGTRTDVRRRKEDIV